jgi:hypothetical protein
MGKAALELRANAGFPQLSSDRQGFDLALNVRTLQVVDMMSVLN